MEKIEKIASLVDGRNEFRKNTKTTIVKIVTAIKEKTQCKNIDLDLETNNLSDVYVITMDSMIIAKIDSREIEHDIAISGKDDLRAIDDNRLENTICNMILDQLKPKR